MNGLTPSKTGATEWPSGPPPRAARGAPEPSEGFAGLLDAHQARTATAEGQDRSSRTSERQDRRDDDGPVANDRAESRSNARWARERRETDGVEREHPDTDKPTDSQPAADQQPAPSPQPAEGGAQTPEASKVQVVTVPVVAPVVAQPVQAPAKDTGQVQQQQQQPNQAAAAPAAVAVTAPGGEAPKVDAAPATETAAAKVAADPKPESQPAVKATAPAPERTSAGPAPQASPAAQAASDKQPKPQHDPQGQPDRQPGTLPQPASDQARTVAQAYGRVHQQQPQAEAPAAQPSTPSVVATPAASNAPGARADVAAATPVPLARAAENVEHVLQLAAARGVTHARIALNPEQLGSIDVHLRHTADGIVAKVVAHAPEAVQQLQQAAADLRRALEGQGLNLLNLDIGHSGDNAGRAGANAGDGGGNAGTGGQQSADDAPAANETTTNSTLQLPNGVLVDVLA